MGMQAGSNQANMIAQQLAQKAQMAAEDQKAKNEGWGGAFGNILGGAASFLGG